MATKAKKKKPTQKEVVGMYKKAGTVKGISFNVDRGIISDVFGYTEDECNKIGQGLFEALMEDEVKTITDALRFYLSQKGSLNPRTPNDYLILGMMWANVRNKVKEIGKNPIGALLEALQEASKR